MALSWAILAPSWAILAPSWAILAPERAPKLPQISFKNISKRYKPISNGDKIKWVYLKQNPLGLSTIAYKGHEDPIEILNFIRQYIDYNKIYKQALHKKIMMLYGALRWDEPTDASKTIERFF